MNNINEKESLAGAENLAESKKIKIKNYHVFALITVTLWASSFAFTKISLEVFTVPVLSMYRFIFAGLFMLIFAIVKKIGLPAKKDIPVFILSAAIGFSVYQLVFNKGIKRKQPK